MKLVSIDKVAKRSVEEAAAYWVVRLEASSCGPADRAAFEKWRAAQAPHAEAYARAQRALAIIDQNLGSIELMDLGERVFEEIRKSRRPFLRSAGMGLAVACTLVLGVVTFLQNGVEPGVDQQPRIVESTFETAVGERSTVILPDDSVVTLNTDSLVEVPYVQNSDVRRLILVRGQAHFAVEKDSRPFEVFAGGQRVVALGTAFDIRIDEDLGVLVTLVEGRVSVYEGGVRGAAAVSPTPESAGGTSSGKTTSGTVLKEGEQLIARPDAPPEVITVDVAQVVGWREGQLVFRDDPLRNVVKEINRYSTKKLVVDDDERLDGIQIGGVFKAGSTESFVAAMEELYPVQARRVAADRVALVWVDRTFDRFDGKDPANPLAR